MSKLHLLFTRDGLQYQLSDKGKNAGKAFYNEEASAEHFISGKLDEILAQNPDEILVISAINHFTLMPEGYANHDAGYTLIGYNAPVDKEKEELMLSVNRKFGVQFYYAFPKNFYEKIKSKNIPVKFNFSGEKFLNRLHSRGGKEIHINLYRQQCEFFAFENKKLKLYNNLDVTSEVDFLYFIMFTLSKIGFGTQETQFFVYGETTENDTFISELQKFVKNLKIVFDNLPERNFMLN